MNAMNELERLLEAERLGAPPGGAAEQGWQRLEAALALGTPGLPVAAGPLHAGFSVAGKWIAVGVSTLALGGGWAIHEQLTSSASTPAASTLPVASVGRQGSVAPRPSSALPPAVPREPMNSGGAPRAQGEPTQQRSERAASPQAQSFDAELRLIEFAKRELDAGQPHLAAAWLSEHASRFPNGVFATERDALSLIIECRDADAVTARERAQRFLRAHRDSPLLDRVGRACGLARLTEPREKPNGSRGER
jgi:hypothetical protein